MSDRNRKSNQFVPGWPTSHAPKPYNESIKTSSIHEESLDLVQINDLQQGQLYIIKIKLIAIGLFQGWDDEMCCFTILRTDLLEDLKWSEARYLPENFDAYLAFDYAGNPPIHLWTKHLRAVIPINWFNIFEEARHMQRQWHVSYWDTPAIEDTHTNKQFYNLTDSPVQEELEEEYDEENKITEVDSNEEKSQTEEPEEIIENNVTEVSTTPTTTTTAVKPYYPPQQQQKNRSIVSQSPTSNASSTADITTTPAMRLQKQYNNKNLNVTQQQPVVVNKPQHKQQQQTEVIVDSKPIITTTTTTTKPEMKQRRSFTSFFLKKKKSKKSLNSNSDESSLKQNRKSAPPTPSIDPKHHFKISESELAEKFKQEISLSTSPSPPELTNSSNSSTKNQEESSSSPTLKTPKNEKVNENDDKLELFDLENYFDMQATFAFLNNSKPDTFSLLDNNNKKSSILN